MSLTCITVIDTIVNVNKLFCFVNFSDYCSDFVQIWNWCSPGWIDVPSRFVSVQLYQYHWHSSECKQTISFCVFLCEYCSNFVPIWNWCFPEWIYVPPRLVSLELYLYHWYSSKCKQIILFCEFLCDYLADFVLIWNRCSPGWIDVPPRLVSLELYQYHWYCSKCKHIILSGFSVNTGSILFKFGTDVPQGRQMCLLG